MAADSGRLRDACAHAHTGSERAIGYKLSRGEEGFYRHFGTATLPTDVSVASLRSHCEFVYRIAALLGFVKFTWHEPLLIIN